MPNGGITPDCVHCKHYAGKPFSSDEPNCQFHSMNLASPIRAFCSQFQDRDDVEDDYIDWLDQELERSSLVPDMMYVWLGGYEIQFFHVLLVKIDDYRSWTRQDFLDALQRLGDEHDMS